MTLITRALAAILAISLSLMPVGAAFADQVLELPPSIASSTPPRAITNPSADETVPRHAHRDAMAPLPKNLGTLQDYERETESSAATPAGYASASINQRFEGNRNRDQFAQNAVLGVLMIGLFAMELSAAHRHRHH